uniref:Uncharacterized protein n=1 Tax=Anguilla anguilla TaxID=7936 RepID=A0A0E9QNN6_ANGAN
MMIIMNCFNVLLFQGATLHKHHQSTVLIRWYYMSC